MSTRQGKSEETDSKLEIAKEIKRLRREKARVEEEVAILKAAMDWAAKSDSGSDSSDTRRQTPKDST